MSEDAMRAALTNDAEALNEAKIALKQESRVIVDYSPASSRHIEALSRMKRLAQVFVAQGRVAKMDRQPRAGAHAYLDVIRLGHQLERGGTIIDSMVAVAVEALGCSALEKLSLQLNAEECREIAAALEAAETRRESIQAILAQEKAWARRAYGFTGVFTRLLTFKQLKAGEQRWAAKRTSQQVRTQRLLIKLASRAYELENGESPKNVSDLVPGYLKTAGSEPLPQLSPKP